MIKSLTDISYIKSVLSRHGFTFSKALGQNFLTDPSVCPRMAAMSGASEKIGVIEIGPGAGVLTAELAKVSDKVVAIELDKRLLPVLDETLSDFHNIKIIHGDAMKLDLAKLIQEEFQNHEVVICANLPYYITSPMIMKLLEERLKINALTVMVQKEAAERLCAVPGTRESGAVSAAVSYYSKPEMLFKVPSTSFMPAPKVDSEVIQLKILKEPSVQISDEKLFFKVIKAAFSQRRKNISNSLSSGLSIAKSDIKEILEHINLSVNTRAEELTMQDFSVLTEEIVQYYQREAQ